MKSLDEIAIEYKTDKASTWHYYTKHYARMFENIRFENIKLFDKTSDINTYKTYDLVCNILKSNGDTNICLKSEDKLTNEIVNQFK